MAFRQPAFNEQASGGAHYSFYPLEDGGISPELFNISPLGLLTPVSVEHPWYGSGSGAVPVISDAPVAAAAVSGSRLLRAVQPVSRMLRKLGGVSQSGQRNAADAPADSTDSYGADQMGNIVAAFSSLSPPSYEEQQQQSAEGYPVVKANQTEADAAPRKRRAAYKARSTWLTVPWGKHGSSSRSDEDLTASEDEQQQPRQQLKRTLQSPGTALKRTGLKSHKRRTNYRCGRCGLPKVGHVCGVPPSDELTKASKRSSGPRSTREHKAAAAQPSAAAASASASSQRAKSARSAAAEEKRQQTAVQQQQQNDVSSVVALWEQSSLPGSAPPLLGAASYTGTSVNSVYRTLRNSSRSSEEDHQAARDSSR